MTATARAVDVAAAVRIVRLIHDDGITQPLRDQVTATAASEHPTVAHVGRWGLKLLDCPWCLTVWAAAAVTGARALGADRLVDLLAVAEISGRVRAHEAD